MNRLRAIPSVERILQALGPVALPRPILLHVVRRELGKLRRARNIPAFEAVVSGLNTTLQNLRRSRIQPVINGTGVILHTNLGRAPLGPAVVDTLGAIAANYNNLEFDLTSGERGGRAGYVEQSLAVLCGAEAAAVANNCAAALVLILRHFTSGPRKAVVISRGELVQIGGGFRIPEILEASGAVLREVGTTNRTTVADYQRAIGSGTALILKVHRSNFFLGGFVESAATTDLAVLARKHRLPFVEDLGSGAVMATEKVGALEHEPTPAEILREGVDLVCFSGDKLLGGPQAGIIAGKNRWVERLKREPFFRALRCDKLILAALQTTVDLYLESAAGIPPAAAVPATGLIQTSLPDLRARADRLADALTDLPVRVVVGQGKARVGGGTLPRSILPSVTLDLQPLHFPVSELLVRLRHGDPPVIGFLAARRLRLDLRTIFSTQDALVVRQVRVALEPTASASPGSRA